MDRSALRAFPTSIAPARNALGRFSTLVVLSTFALTGCGGLVTFNGGSGAPNAMRAPASRSSSPAAAATPTATEPSATEPASHTRNASASSKAPTMTDVWLVDVAKERVTPQRMERPDDIIALFQALDPKLLVHTTGTAIHGKYCTNIFTPMAACWTFEDGYDQERMSEPDFFHLPKHGATIAWQAEEGTASVHSAAVGKAIKPIAPNTPGFIVWGVQGDPDHVLFLALDGGYYYLSTKSLELGAPPASAWPAGVQHSGYDARKLAGEYSSSGGEEVPVSVRPALTTEFDKKLDTFRGCVAGIFKSGASAFAANDAANITEQTRRNRAKQLDDTYIARAENQCRASFVALGGTYGKILDERRADRQRVYAAAQARFKK